MNFKVDILDFEQFQEFSNSSYNLEDGIEYAKDILLEYYERNKNNECNYDSDLWVIEYKGVETYFNFRDIEDEVQFYKHIETDFFKDVVKNWVAINLGDISPKRVKNSYTKLLEFIRLSKCFNSSIETIKEVEAQILMMDESKKYHLSLFMLNFISFYEEIDPTGEYTVRLNAIKESISYKELENVRILPRPKDLIMFNLVINDYFGKLKDSSIHYYMYAPILLWWRLTTIIPLRPFEFCGIKRNALDNKDGGYFIHLPRSDSKGKKRVNKNNIQIIDTIALTEEMYNLFDSYIEKTNQFGETETLLSYKAVSWAYKELNGQEPGTRNKKIFSYSSLRRLLIRFYDEVVQGDYLLSVRSWEKQVEDRQEFKKNLKKKNRELLQLVDNTDGEFLIHRQLRLGDTRHIALLNMQRLGAHPVEMARLAGHQNLRTQGTYHSHQLKWIDTEVLKLMTDLKLQNVRHTIDSNGTFGFTARDVKDSFETDTEWKDKFVFKGTDFNKKIVQKKLDLGFCKDEEQRCPVNDCPCGCDYWGISMEEYNEKKEIIDQKIEKAEARLISLVSALIDLHKFAIENYGEPGVSETNLNFNRELMVKSRKINESLAQLLEMKTIKERKIINA